MMNRLFYRVKRKQNRFFFGNLKRIVVDDVHLMSEESFRLVEHLAVYREVLCLRSHKGDGQEK